MDVQDIKRHINELELLATLYALKAFTSHVSNLSVRLMLDNFTAVHYINKAGERDRQISAPSRVPLSPGVKSGICQLKQFIFLGS
jgi:hypothetical protein